MRVKILFILALILFVWSHSLFAQSIAQWDTDMGMFRVELREDLVPITVNNFILLADTMHFYDGLIFHRVVANFVIQDGCPNGDGTGGPGWTIPLEIHEDLRHDAAGIIGMARSSDPNSAGSQYYFTLSPQPSLDDRYAVFGEVVNGLDVVLAIGEVPVDMNDKPLEDVVIDSVRILGVVYPHLEIRETKISDSPENSDNDGVVNPLETGELSVRLKNWQEPWLIAEDAVGTLICGDDRITITDSVATFGTIVTNDSTDNFDDPFKFNVNVNEVFTTQCTLRLEANPDSAYPYMVEYEIELEVSLHQAGWPLALNGGSNSSALITDIDNNGENEIIFGDNNGYLHAYQSDGMTELNGFPINFASTIGCAVAIGNIDGDEELEIVVGDYNGTIHAINHDGTTLFSYALMGQIRANPMIADVDGDGSMEVIAISITGQTVVLNADGTEFGNFPANIGPGVISSGAMGDLDGDGNLEILVSNIADGGSIHAISTATADNISGWPHPIPGANSYNGPIVADINSDGTPEVLAGLSDGKLVAINADGSEHFSKNVSSEIKSSVIAKDLQDDGSMEIVFINNDGALYVTDHQGNELYDTPINLDVTVQSSPILADLNGNGTLDIIFGDDTGYLHAIDVDGSTIENFPLLVNQNQLPISPIIGDLDGDHDPEIALPNINSHYFVMDYKQEATVGWACFKANACRTGNSAQALSGISPKEKISVAPKNFLGNNYPNPFNPRTTIHFGLSKSGKLSLKIYDIAGKLIKTLTQEENWEAGYHKIIWNGTDNQNKAVSSGVYFYRMETDQFQQVRSMILLR